MSGRKQHFIPQSLLKGFGRPGKGDKVQVIVYTHDHGIFPAATDGVAAQREFYSKLAVEGEDETLDDKITAYETPLANTLATLRKLGDGEPADKQSASQFVTHLVVRNNHLRKIMSTAGTAMIDGFAAALSNEDQAKTMLGLAGETASGMFAKQMDEAFAKYEPLIRMLGMSKEQFKVWAFQQGQADFANLHAQILAPMQHAFSETAGKLTESAAEAHSRSLGNSLSPEPRVEKMMECEWRVVHSNTPLILPDCVAVAIDANGETFSLILAESDEPDTIYVPLSSDRLLVGSKTTNDVPADLNDVSASCAWDFFVASDRAPELEGLRDRIRSRTGPYLNDTIDGVISEALKNPFKKPEDSPPD